MKRIVIAAPSSGSGKTTVTLAIMAALRKRGLTVAPFKVGPDFIDPGYHALASGAGSVNLDGWICGHDFIRDTFALRAAKADVAVVEGVMGLFDGIDGASEAGSTAEMAKLLGAPVILVVDARSQARSAAALLHGFASFDPALSVAGVIFNNVGSANHEEILRQAVSTGCGDLAVIGCIPKEPALAIPSRHLGLLTAEDNPLSADFLGQLSDVAERHLDLGQLLSIAGAADKGAAVAAGRAVAVESAALGKAAAVAVAPSCRKESLKIAVARDAAFCFVYQDNLRLLREQGAELVFFSPLADPLLPPNVSGVYLPGGYPELFAAALAGNDSLKTEIRGAVESGMPVYAECGGFIYLTRGVDNENGRDDFVGIFPVQTRMLPRRKALGYREIHLLADGIIGAKGTVARGHEFHYSETEPMPQDVQRLYAVNRKGVLLGEEGYRYKNCLASYVHLHFGSSPAVAESLVRHCRDYMNGSLT